MLKLKSYYSNYIKLSAEAHFKGIFEYGINNASYLEALLHILKRCFLMVFVNIILSPKREFNKFIVWNIPQDVVKRIDTFNSRVRNDGTFRKLLDL